MWEKSSRNRESQEGDVNAELSLPDKIEALGGRAKNRNDLFRRAAFVAGISYSQAKRIFYGETTDPKSSVRTKIERAMNRLNEKAEAHAKGQAERTADIGQLVARAVEADEDLRREVLALVLQRLSGSGPEDSALD
jgi:hypothetical protein